MSLLFVTTFDGTRLNVLLVRGRPALLAHELGIAAGHLDSGQSFVRSVRMEWAEALHDDDDVAELVGAELQAIKREVPTLGECATALVLFPSGVEKTLSRCHARYARSLLGHLHAEVYSRVATIPPRPVPRAVPVTATPSTAAPSEAPRTITRLLLVAEQHLPERLQHYRAVRTFAALVLQYEEDIEEYLNLERQALEILLGREIELLTPPPTPVAPRSASAAA